MAFDDPVVDEVHTCLDFILVGLRREDGCVVAQVVVEMLFNVRIDIFRYRCLLSWYVGDAQVGAKEALFEFPPPAAEFGWRGGRY